MLLAGIDEAGYSPLLGPLVVSAVGFRLAEHRNAERGVHSAEPENQTPNSELRTPNSLCDLWKLLGPAVARPGGRKRGASAIPVGDSKKLYHPGKGLQDLELGVLSFLGAARAIPGDEPELFAALGNRLPAELAPWYRIADEALALLPRAVPAETLARNAARLRGALSARGLETATFASRLLLEQDYNQHLRRLDNKATLLWELVRELLRELWKASAREQVSVVVDRLGGRADYYALLQEAFPEAWVWEIEGGRRRAKGRRRKGGPSSFFYRVEAGLRRMELAFQEKADATSFPTALASMTSKYLRELLMARLNSYWQNLVPGLNRTSGYHRDARAFLAATAALRAEMKLPDEEFIRQR